MNILKIRTGVYRLAKPISNPYHDKKRPKDWRCQQEFPTTPFYCLDVRSDPPTTENVGGKLFDRTGHSVYVSNGSPGLGTMGSIRFDFTLHTAHGKKPRISDITVPDGCDPVPLDFLCALKPDFSARGLLIFLDHRNFFCHKFDAFDILEKLVESGKITATDIREVAMQLSPHWYLWQHLMWKP